MATSPPTRKLVGVERHCLGFVADAVILPAEADAAVLACEGTTIGDGDAMGIAAEIVEHLFGSAERAFGVDDRGDAATADFCFQLSARRPSPRREKASTNVSSSH